MYHSLCCGDELLELKDDDVLFDFNIEKFAKQVYNLNLTDEVFKEAWTHDFKTLNKALSVGYETSIDIATGIDLVMLKNLQTNVAVFSAFKNHELKNELIKELVDDEGNLVDWNTFKKKAKVLGTKYKTRFLKAEYHHAVGSSNKARQWIEFDSNKDLYPNLKYIAIKDGRTRKTHKEWDGIVLPMNHPFWSTHYPPNDWGCRCDVIQVDDEVDNKGASVDKMVDLKPSFNINVGKDGQVFGEDHPYYKSHEYKQTADWAKKALKEWNTKA